MALTRHCYTTARMLAIFTSCCLLSGQGFTTSTIPTSSSKCSPRFSTTTTSLLTSNSNLSRRQSFATLLAPFATAFLKADPSNAFANGIPEMERYKDKRKYPGKPPQLGIQEDDGKLLTCDGAGLNCFSTTGDEAHMLPMWKPKAGTSSKVAMAELLQTIQAYPPGQNKTDKGGFQIMISEPNYLYIQYESMKHGFIDDVEFAIDSSNSKKDVLVQVRSSSRMGQLDLGVNARRLNWISSDLRSKGWYAPAITKEDYPEYFALLVFTYDDYIRSVLSPKDCPVPALPLECKDPSP